MARMASASGHGFVGLNYPEIVHSSVVLVLKDDGFSLPTIPELRYPVVSTDLTNDEVSLNNADQNAVRYIAGYSIRSLKKKMGWLKLEKKENLSKCLEEMVEDERSMHYSADWTKAIEQNFTCCKRF